MDLVDFCKKYNILNHLQEALKKVIAFYKQHQTLLTMPNIEDEFGRQEGENVRNIIIYIQSIHTNDVQLMIQTSLEDEYGELMLENDDIQRLLNIDQIRVLNMYIFYFSDTSPLPSGLGL